MKRSQCGHFADLNSKKKKIESVKNINSEWTTDLGLQL